MAKEIQASYQPGRTVYALIFNATGSVYSSATLSFVTYSATDYANYVVSLSEVALNAGIYFGNMPAVSPGVYSIIARDQTGGSTAASDPVIACGDLQWNGSAVASVADAVTSGQFSQVAPLRIARGVAVTAFPFKLVSSADHVTPFTSGTVSGQISRDGGSFGPLAAPSITELGLGWYRANLTSGDLLANTIALTFSAANAGGGTSDARDFAFVLQRTSGQ